jgi:hypothetical protein
MDAEGCVEDLLQQEPQLFRQFHHRPDRFHDCLRVREPFCALRPEPSSKVPGCRQPGSFDERMGDASGPMRRIRVTLGVVV